MVELDRFTTFRTWVRFSAAAVRFRSIRFVSSSVKISRDSEASSPERLRRFERGFELAFDSPIYINRDLIRN